MILNSAVVPVAVGSIIFPLIFEELPSKADPCASQAVVTSSKASPDSTKSWKKTKKIPKNSILLKFPGNLKNSEKFREI